jgi:hypothetical protein
MFHATLSRRDVLRTASCGFGSLALAGLCSQVAKAAADANPLSAKRPHFEPRAKRVIFMFMQGAPSHVDTFDYKPALERDDGKSPGAGVGGKGNRKLMKSPWKFHESGESGLLISELFPHLAKNADDLCLLNGMHTDLPNHPQASVQLHTGSFQFVRPSLGAWVLYGLGTENAELPGFITINPVTRVGGAISYGSSFLPAPYQGTPIGAENRPLKNGVSIPNIANRALSKEQQRSQLDLLQQLNRDRLAEDQVNTELEGVIESYELAFRMQTAVPKIMDFADESPSTLESYGIGGGPTDNFGRQCLMARRFAEAGVRFIQVSHSDSNVQWDQHSDLKAGHEKNAREVDLPIAGLLTDLKARGMLDDTLIWWGGEFGRTPTAEGTNGRDHNPEGFTMWLAGGGVKGGFRYGATDDYGYYAAENKVHIHDLHATILHLLGLDHEKLTYRYAGRDFRLTDVEGTVVRELFA